jgi:hypothetical protein
MIFKYKDIFYHMVSCFGTPLKFSCSSIESLPSMKPLFPRDRFARFTISVIVCAFLLISISFFLLVASALPLVQLIHYVLENFLSALIAMAVVAAFFFLLWQCLGICFDSSTKLGKYSETTTSNIVKLVLFLQIIFFLSVFLCFFSFPTTRSRLPLHSERRKFDEPSTQVNRGSESTEAVKTAEEISQQSNPFSPLKIQEQHSMEGIVDFNTEIGVVDSSIVLERSEVFPVRVRSANSDDLSAIPADSLRKLRDLSIPIGHISLQRLFDTVVDFPDLQFRSGEVIRAQYPVIFEDLPISSGSSGEGDRAPAPSYDSRYKSPCWVTKRAPKGAGAMVGSELSAGQLVCLPYVYVLGQPKCGTSDLFERLRD